MKKCWEVMKCGREAGGVNAEKEGICPAYPDNGNTCSKVAGTYCGGEIQGTYAKKLHNCLKCKFYRSEHYDR